jgi:hypothetical protein
MPKFRFPNIIKPSKFDLLLPRFLHIKPFNKLPLHFKKDIDGRRIGPLLTPTDFDDTKDPCPVYDGSKWHIFGSAGSKSVESWRILHATAPDMEGPWTLEDAATLHGVEGPHVAAPGVIYDHRDELLHMFVQTDFAALGNSIEYLISHDGGRNFIRVGTALNSLPNTTEAGVYDPHPAVIKNAEGHDEYYIVYTGVSHTDSSMTESGTPIGISHGDIFLAKSKSKSWLGPWDRLGTILTHAEVPHHNQHDHPDYEWGLEGAQLIQLPNKKILLNAACFLPEGPRGTRQRIFFAIADQVMGPYKTLGAVLDPSQEDWESGENGHAAAFIQSNKFYLFYQARSKAALNFWRYGIATWDISTIQRLAQEKLTGPTVSV